MSKRGKIFLIVGLILVSPVVAVLIAPQFWKGKLIQAIKTELNRATAAEVNFSEDLSLSLWKNFPDLNVEIRDLSVLSPGFSNDTLFWMPSLALRVDLKSVWKGETINVKALSIKDALVHVEYDSLGKANYEVLLAPGDTSEPSTLKLDLKHVSLSNSRIQYVDLSSDMSLHLDSVDALASAALSGDTMTLKSDLAVRSLSYVYEDVAFVDRARLNGKANLFMDMGRMDFRFLENAFTLNDIPIKFNGNMQLPENGDVVMDLAMDCPGVTLQQALSLVPEEYASYLDGLQASGETSVKGQMKGIYNDTIFPDYSVQATLNKGRLKYTSMPLPMEDIQLNLSFESKEDATLLTLEPLRFTLQREPFALKLTARELFGDPLLNGEMQGKLHFDRFAQFFPLEKGTRLAGLLAADVQFNGRTSAFESGKLNKDNRAIGSLKISDLLYRGPELNADVRSPITSLSFTPDFRALLRSDLVIGQSDMAVSGELKNVLAILTSGQNLDASIQLRSNKLNVDELLSFFPASENIAPASAVTSSTAMAPELPKNLHLDLVSEMGTLIYNKISFSNVKAKARLFDGALNISNAELMGFGGKLGLNGAYQPADGKGMFTDLNLDLSLLNIPAFLGSFDLTKKLTPFYERLEGKMNATLHLSSILNSDLSPDLGSLNLQGLFNGSALKLHQLPGLKNLGDRLQIRELQEVETKALQLAVELLSGKLNVKPFSIEHKGIRLELGGFTTLDQKIDYKGKLFLPASMVQGNEKIWNDLVSRTPFKAASVSPDDILEIHLGILGTALKPEIKLSLKDVKKGLKGAIEDRIKSELDQRKKEAEDRAKAELDAAKKQAEQKAREMEEKARQELENQKKAAEQRAREEADRRRKELEEAARKKLKDVLKPPL